MLAVPNGAEAMEFFKKAFGATERWKIGDGEVAGMYVDGAPFFFANETPRAGPSVPDVPVGRPSASNCSSTTRRRGTSMPSPVARPQATASWNVTTDGGPEPWSRMLQGMKDPFGHVWLIGWPLGQTTEE